VILQQVLNGVAVRMAVLYLLGTRNWYGASSSGTGLVSWFRDDPPRPCPANMNGRMYNTSPKS